MTNQSWNVEHVPDLSGKTIVVTGGNSGLGYETVRGLAPRKARLVLACRDLGKAGEAIQSIRAEHPDADLQAMELDLSSLDSIRKFSDAFRSGYESLDVLCNNAGVMALPYRKTADGFEMQLGTNHLGHFALTGQLLDRLLETPGSRVVTVSSAFHNIGKMNFDDLHGERGYRKWNAYAQSKLANLLFSYELQRRLSARGSATISLAAHPGYAATNLQTAGPRMQGSSILEHLSELGNRLLAQSAAMGALPTLYAVASPDVAGGDFIGPDGFGEMRGHPRKVSSSKRSRDVATAKRLWEISEELTGTRYAALG